jgi:predicted ATP-grasp superfamily ATP-dependent carboligase
MTIVLVTDARYKHALAAVRNLSAHGLRIIAAAPDTSTRRLGALASRHTTARAVYPDPATCESDFIRVLGETLEMHEVDVLLPVGDATVRAVARNRSALPDRVRVPLGKWRGSIDIAADKRRSLELAERLGVPVPAMFTTPGHAHSYPVVVKPRAGSGGVRYITSRAAATATFDPERDLCEEYIDGVGCAYFGLFEHGAERAFFMHRRIREFPPSGGPSTAAESINDPELRDLGVRLLSALGWHGVAMVEFKRDRRDNTYKFMEINPKFWGSLELATAAGVEFPWLAVQLALEKRIEETPLYVAGLRFQWIVDDMRHVLARPRSARAFAGDLCSPETQHDLHLDDIRPFAATAADLVARGLSAGARRAARRSHSG